MLKAQVSNQGLEFRLLKRGLVYTMIKKFYFTFGVSNSIFTIKVHLRLILSQMYKRAIMPRKIYLTNGDTMSHFKKKILQVLFFMLGCFPLILNASESNHSLNTSTVEDITEAQIVGVKRSVTADQIYITDHGIYAFISSEETPIPIQ